MEMCLKKERKKEKKRENEGGQGERKKKKRVLECLLKTSVFHLLITVVLLLSCMNLCYLPSLGLSFLISKRKKADIMIPGILEL